MSRLTKSVFFSLCLLIFTAASFCEAAEENPFTYLTEDAPPQNYVKDGEPRGLAVEILKDLWRRMGMKPGKIKLVPWTQGYRQALSTPNTVIFSTTRLEAREKLFKWVGPIRTPRLGLIGKKERLLKVASLGDLKKYRVATVIDDASETLLLSRNVPAKNLVRFKTLKAAINSLTAGSVDMIAYGEENVWFHLKEQGFSRNMYEKVLTMSGQADFYAFNKETPDAVIKRFQDAFLSMKKDGSYDRLLAKYGPVD